jgi:hypothetical protein
MLAVFFVVVLPLLVYTSLLVEVPNQSMAILIHKVGKDLDNSQCLAPSDDIQQEYKGIQAKVLKEGRYFLNPYEWDWEVVPQIQIPIGKLGVRIRLYGEDLPPGQLVAWPDATGKERKGIVPEVLNPGRYYINGQIQGAPPRKTGDSYAEVIELHDPVSIPAGYKGVMTYLSAPMPKKPNEVVVEAGTRGVQTETLEPGTYYLNPYVARVCLMDCRSQRYNLKDIGFPTKDGFWVSLEAIIEFRVNPQEASRVYVLFNEDRNNEPFDEQVIEKIILPNARAYTRLRGSSHSGKEFITGDTRAVFQEDFQKQMQHTCATQGIEVIQALITTIRPPEKIAEPVRRRQIALQQESQYKKEILQQTAEQELAVQKATVDQKKAEVVADQSVVVVTVEATQKQEVAIIEANKRLGVAQQKLDAAKDQAAAVLAKGKADADVVRFDNRAQAAGWQKGVEAFGGNGAELARYTLLKKLAPAFKSLMINTENSSLLDIFKSFDSTRPPAAEPASAKRSGTSK